MPETIKEVLQLRGLNLRQEKVDVEDPEARFLSNLDPFREPGALNIRKGRDVLLGSFSPELLLRTIARINATRYQVAGRHLYRAGKKIASDLAANLQTQLTPFRPLNDSITWAFVADDDFMLKDDSKTGKERLFLWGLDQPLLPGPKVANQTGKNPGDTITAGTYKIAVTQLRYDPYTTV